ncbi:MAG: MBL fold metallo-hydrolase [Planctomycetes bacterium]|nr:MBL fold metallo-hydrolase [Planctomycetota bacterium]
MQTEFLRGAVAALVLVWCVQPACGQAGNPPLTLSQAVSIVSGSIDAHGPLSVGATWSDRKAHFDFLDAIMHVPPQITQHPLADPIRAQFIAALHLERLDRTIRQLKAVPFDLNEHFRLHKLYSSSWIIETPTSALAIDFCTGFFYLSGFQGFRFDQIDALADRLDAYLITHPHPDHYSPQLIQAMLLRGKPVYVTDQMKTGAVVSGSTLGPLLSVATPGRSFGVGDIRFEAFLGHQYLGFLDPAQTIPDLSLPSVTNNVFLVQIHGQGIIHAGDNNDVNVLPWLSSVVASGRSVDIVLNTGPHASQFLALTGAPRLFQSHDLEMTHLEPVFIDLNLPAAPDPLRTVLMWGEYYAF